MWQYNNKITDKSSIKNLPQRKWVLLLFIIIVIELYKKLFRENRSHKKECAEKKQFFYSFQWNWKKKLLSNFESVHEMWHPTVHDSYQRSRRQSETIFKCANTCKSLNQIKWKSCTKKKSARAQRLDVEYSKRYKRNIERILRECKLQFFFLFAINHLLIYGKIWVIQFIHRYLFSMFYPYTTEIWLDWFSQ